MTTWRCLLHQANRQIRSAVKSRVNFRFILPCLISRKNSWKISSGQKRRRFLCWAIFFVAPAKHHQRHSPVFHYFRKHPYSSTTHQQWIFLNDLKTFSVLPETIRFQGSREAAVQRLRAAIAPFLLRQVGPFEWLGFSINMGYPT